MNCEHFRERILSHLCGELDKEEDLQLAEHLKSCQDCKKEHSEFSAILGLLHQLPSKEWNEKLQIHEMLRKRQKWQAIVFSKAALWFLSLTALIAVISSLPVRWELTADQFSVRWGNQINREEKVGEELKRMQVQLAEIQKQNQNFHQVSETRLKQLVEQNSVEQEKRYWQTLEMFTNYLQAERTADLQKIQHDIAATYDRTGNEVERTNELLQYVLRASSPADGSGYEAN